jgi:transketolase
MRKAMGSSLAKIFRNKPNSHLFCGDIGYGVFDQLRKESPSQFHNFGISEQHMVSFAAAYAYTAKATSVVYTINPFITSRVHDQLRVDVAYSKAPLVICSVGAGFAYDTLGFTHFGLEDLALIQCLPNFKIYTPSGPDDIDRILESIFKAEIISDPCYIRLQKGGEEKLGDQFEGYQDKAHYKYWHGTDVQIVTHGAITEEVLLAREQVSKFLSVAVHSVIDWDEYLLKSVNPLKKVIFIEEHRETGSLAQRLMVKYASSGVIFEKISQVCVNTSEFDFSVSRKFALEKNCLDRNSIINLLKNI